MKRILAVTALGAVMLPIAIALAAPGDPPGLKEPQDFSGIADPGTRSVALFEEMGKVIRHPRCMNCHPRTDRPSQTDAQIPHMPAVTRGPTGHGAPALECATCHADRNIDFAAGGGSLPGHADWHLAPREMAWQGVSLGDICRQIKDPKRNGGKTLAEIQTHNAEDGLVGWGWRPGPGRTPVPGTQAGFGRLTQAWIDTGAQCPS